MKSRSHTAAIHEICLRLRDDRPFCGNRSAERIWYSNGTAQSEPLMCEFKLKHKSMFVQYIGVASRYVTVVHFAWGRASISSTQRYNSIRPIGVFNLGCDLANRFGTRTLRLRAICMCARVLMGEKRFRAGACLQGSYSILNNLQWFGNYFLLSKWWTLNTLQFVLLGFASFGMQARR